MVENKNSTIAKNTILLYFRQIIILIIGLYTSRVILNTLGVTDYGLYNVVGGVVAMFGFITNAMGNATSRFITFSTGKDNLKDSEETFGTILTIYYIIAFAILLLGETIGLWFLYNYLVIPEERFAAALWVYHFSVIAAVMNVLYIPYNSLIIAHEKMTAFAYISILDALLKLIIVYLLVISSYDKLIVYAVLIFLVQCIDRFIYIYYCRRKFVESKSKAIYRPKLFQEILVFSGWTLNGNIAVMCYTQGINILLNMFFGPVVNAARGVATQVQTITLNFVSGFQTAVYPQITKSYAQGDMHRLYNLLHASCRYSYFLIFMLALPFIIKSQYVLELWLKIVPDYTVPFLSLILLFSMLRSITNPVNFAVQATGDIKKFQLIEGTLGLMILPLAYIQLKVFHSGPVSVFVILVIVEFITIFVRIYIGVKKIKGSLSLYFLRVIRPIFITTIVGTSIPYVVSVLTEENFTGTILTYFTILIWTFPSIYFCGLSATEKNIIKDKVINMAKKQKKVYEK